MRRRRSGSTAHERRSAYHRHVPSSKSSPRCGNGNAYARRALERRPPAPLVPSHRRHDRAMPKTLRPTLLVTSALRHAAGSRSGAHATFPIAALVIPRFRTFGVLGRRPLRSNHPLRCGRHPRTLKISCRFAVAGASDAFGSIQPFNDDRRCSVTSGADANLAVEAILESAGARANRRSGPSAAVCAPQHVTPEEPQPLEASSNAF